MDILKGHKVVEFATVLAGPNVGMFLAELGAEVIKVEHPPHGDVTRSWKLPEEDKSSRVSAYYAAVNYGKEHRYLDLKDDGQRAEAVALAADADIVLTNFKEGGAARFGLDYPSIKTTNPAVIYAELSGFESSPSRVAYDVVLQAESGYMSMNGHPEGPPTKLPLAFMDLLAAHDLKEGILTALLRRATTGSGAYVHCSLERSAVTNLANQASNFLTAGHVPSRLGSLHPNIAPYGEVMLCKDGRHIVLAVGTNHQFELLMNTIAPGESWSAELFGTNALRVDNRKELGNLLAQKFSAHNSVEVLQKLIDLDVPAGAIKHMDEVFENEVAQDVILEDEQEGTKLRRVSTVGFRVD